MTGKPRLYLITPPVSDAAAFPPALEAALAAHDVACVLVQTGACDDASKEETLRARCPRLQKHGIACLIPDDPQLALRVNADGVHIDGIGPQLQSALHALQPGRIVGAGGLKTRDAAMTAGEAGVDYLMFGGPHDLEPHAQIVEEVAWWAEIFNVPCVGYAHNLDAIADLVHAGADFIALGDAIFGDPRGAEAAVGDAARLILSALETVQ